MRKPADIRNQRFHTLTALYPTNDRDEKGSVVWHCRCDCGNELDVSYNRLRYTNQTSCGCQRARQAQRLHTHLTQVADTSLDSLKSTRIPVNNTTGHRGVYFIRGKYVAKINFQKKAYYLGSYDSIADAVAARKAARKAAREQLFDRAADFCQCWQSKADTDPAWAESNPVRIKVTRKENGDFHLTLLPKLEG